MQNLWSDRDAEACVSRYAEQGVDRLLALRVYTTRLLGGERRLVLHGGGNTSVKTTARDLLGEPVDVICVKGSGWDMAGIEPAGLPAVRLDPLRELLDLETLTDEAMVNAQRCNLLDAAAPTPSVETLLHAFLPHRYIDHTHANAVLALGDQPDGFDRCRELFGARVAVLPYIAPGFALSKAAYRAWETQPECEGLVLEKHGIFTFGDDARAAYDRMIDLVTVAEEWIASARRVVPVRGDLPGTTLEPATLAPIVRGLTAVAGGSEGKPRPTVLSFRTGPRILEFVNGRDLSRYANAGVVTPDHVIRIKPRPLILDPPQGDDLEGFRSRAEGSMASFVESYREYFARQDAREATRKIPLDPAPRIILVPGLGFFAAGGSARAAEVAADVAESAMEVVLDAEAIGEFRSITEAETFDMEYWSLEQAKLGRGAPKALQGKVVLISGGAGTIGRATGEAFAAHGAEIALLDRDEAVLAAAADFGGLGVVADVTEPSAVEDAVAQVCTRFGGVDILVSNAGAAWQGRIGEVSEDLLRRSFELNFFAHQTLAKSVVRCLLAQGTGGCLLFNVSKQAVNPGPNFGPYGLPKAATMALVRQYAIDYGADGIRASGVNADRIRSGLLTDEMIRTRSKARGVSEVEYLSGNLLHRPVEAEDVARAFVSLALAPATTAAIVTVDGGNIAAALR